MTPLQGCQSASTASPNSQVKLPHVPIFPQSRFLHMVYQLNLTAAVVTLLATAASQSDPAHTLWNQARGTSLTHWQWWHRSLDQQVTENHCSMALFLGCQATANQIGLSQTPLFLWTGLLNVQPPCGLPGVHLWPPGLYSVITPSPTCSGCTQGTWVAHCTSRPIALTGTGSTGSPNATMEI